MRFRLLASLGIAATLLLPTSLLAETVKGRIMEISRLANTIQINVPNKDPVVIRFGPETRFIETTGIDDLTAPDLIEVEFEPGQPASQIKKVIFGLPPGIEIDVQQMLGILTSGQTYTLIDTRPKKPYLMGHIPSASQAFPKDEDFVSKLPADKNGLLVFYCGGPTCPYTAEAVGIAQQNGSTNIKGFQAGHPGWQKAELPLHADPQWVSESLDPAHVIIDTRDPAVSAQRHLPGAVTMPAAEFEALTAQFIRDQSVAELPGVSDLRAPIILYSDTHASPDVLVAFREVRSWGYRNTTILRDGMNGWVSAGLPVESNQLASSINFVKKLAPGAINPEEFLALEKSREGVMLLDVRSVQEAASGTISDSLHIPLEQVEANLDKLDKDKEILAYCANGIRAEMVYRALTAQGFKVRYLNENLEIAQDGSFRIL
jgi:rhodanese-related sulfurtransferase